jgi:hypothetical protein
MGAGAGEQLGQHGEVAVRPLLRVERPRRRGQLAEGRDVRQATRVLLRPARRDDDGRFGEEGLDRAEVVEDERLVHVGGARDGPRRRPGDPLLGEGAEGGLDEAVAGRRRHVRMMPLERVLNLRYRRVERSLRKEGV